MAIIHSVVVGAGVKSVGEVSLRRVKGRTIASRRVWENKSRTPLQAAQRSDFKAVQEMVSAMPFLWKRYIERGKYNTAYNEAFKVNYDFLQSQVETWNSLSDGGMIANILINTFGSGYAEKPFYWSKGITPNLITFEKTGTPGSIRIVVQLTDPVKRCDVSLITIKTNTEPTFNKVSGAISVNEATGFTEISINFVYQAQEGSYTIPLILVDGKPITLKKEDVVAWFYS